MKQYKYFAFISGILEILFRIVDFTDSLRISPLFLLSCAAAPIFAKKCSETIDFTAFLF